MSFMAAQHRADIESVKRALLVVLSALVLVPALPARAQTDDDPARLGVEVEAAQAHLDDLSNVESAATEAANAAGAELARTSGRAVAARRAADAAAEERRLAQEAVAGRAGAADKGGGAATAASLLLGSRDP